MISATYLALVAVALALLLVLGRWVARKTTAERASRPRALARAELVYMEKLFRIREPIRLVAKVDRVYRLPGGPLVVVELKTRWQDRPYLSDVIQLSAQRLVIAQQTGEAVARYGFVSIARPHASRAVRSHRVELLDEGGVIAIHHRRLAILAGRRQPEYTVSHQACRDCAYRSRCDRITGSEHRRR